MLYADTLFRNGRFITLDPACPQAEALAVRDAKIAALGSNRELDVLVGPRTAVIDLDNTWVVPGFHDAHCHILLFGLSLVEIDSREAKTIYEVVQSVASHALRARPGVWLRGGGYNENNLAEGRHPTRFDLDRVTAHNPTWISHVSGHMGVANSQALRRASVTSDTIDPPGGHIARDEHGQPSGLLIETAQELIKSVLPPYSQQKLRAALSAAGRRMTSEGITSAQDAWAGWIAPQEYRAYQEATAEQILPQRVRLMVDIEKLAAADRELVFGFGLHTGFGNERLKLGAMKLFLDGSLIGRTAALSSPYTDIPESAGFLVKSQAEIFEQVHLAYANGWQIAMHAIGDKAIEVGIDAIEASMGNRAPKFRPRLEHCGILRPDLIKRIKKLGIVVVTQPRFINELGDSFRIALGEERLRRTYPMAGLSGLQVAFSSDRPVVQGAPLLGIEAAVRQKTASGCDYVPEEAISVTEALRRYTEGSAYSAFEEHEKGTLSPGKWADFVALDTDIIQHGLEKLAETKVEKTIIGGEVHFER